MIYFEVGKTQRASHRSGLTRVSRRLLEEFRDSVTPTSLFADGKDFAARAKTFAPKPTDWWLTAELFSESDYPGFWEFIREPRCRLAAVFHDAIPLKWPHITWPRSVSRHPEYMKMLAGFDQVFAVSEASRRDLVEFWAWQGVSVRAAVTAISLGADLNQSVARFQGRQDSSVKNAEGKPLLLSVGIVEPRKNQSFILEVCEALWNEGLQFELHLVGRVNPHFGKPIVARIDALRKKHPSLHYHEQASDDAVLDLYRRAWATIFATIAEGCGLPLLESLWQGVPCVCSDLPVLQENASGGGCLSLPVNDLTAWKTALRSVLTDTPVRDRLALEARQRALPTWAQTAHTIKAGLRS